VRSRRKRKQRRIIKREDKSHLSPVPAHCVARYDRDMRKTRLVHWWQFYFEVKYGQF
jgi:hypothetical protein